VTCGAWVINPQFSPLCDGCLHQLESHDCPTCYYCGLGLPGSLSEAHSVCALCRSGAPSFDWARSTGPYEGQLRDVIRKFKFDGFQKLAYPLAERMVEAYSLNLEQFQASCIVPVPLHPKRKRERGFDQTLTLCRVLASRLRLPVVPVVRRVRHTLPQFGLDRLERKKNVEKAFQVSDAAEIAGARLLLVDDVMTTGATVDEICKLLRETSQVREIMVLTVARVQLFRDWF